VLLIRARQVREEKLPPEHSYLATTLHSLVRLREPIRQTALPVDHPYRAKLLEDWLQQVQPGEFAARYKDFKTGLARNPDGDHVQSYFCGLDFARSRVWAYFWMVYKMSVLFLGPSLPVLQPRLIVRWLDWLEPTGPERVGKCSCVAGTRNVESPAAGAKSMCAELDALKREAADVSRELRKIRRSRDVSFYEDAELNGEKRKLINAVIRHLLVGHEGKPCPAGARPIVSPDRVHW